MNQRNVQRQTVNVYEKKKNNIMPLIFHEKRTNKK